MRGCERSRAPRMCSPMTGCCLMRLHSCSHSGPILHRTASGTPTLPTSWRSPQNAASLAARPPIPNSPANAAAYRATRRECARVYASLADMASATRRTASAKAPGGSARVAPYAPDGADRPAPNPCTPGHSTLRGLGLTRGELDNGTCASTSAGNTLHIGVSALHSKDGKYGTG